MTQLLIKDVLSWDRFFEEANKRLSYPPKNIELFNRLVAYTNNFFLISAIGAFTSGYLMLITKKLLPSFSMVDDRKLDELKWLIEVTINAINKTYKRKVVKFEHGMCACVGGLDRAHLHLMTIDSSVGDDLLRDSINKALIKRKAGIDSVEINGHKLENIHDIIEIMNSPDSASYKVNGKQLFYEDIYNNLEITIFSDHDSRIAADDFGSSVIFAEKLLKDSSFEINSEIISSNEVFKKNYYYKDNNK